MKSQKTVILGMSGGVDSSVAAILLQKQGYKVIGAFMKCFSDTKNKLTGECNWVAERKMAQKVAAQLKISLITLDFEEAYKKEVINPMFKAYQRGLTPNPDMTCNTLIKFPLLWKEAKKYGADYIATGHYARIKKTKQGFQLLAGKDKTKDQSYFLAELTQADLSHTLFPLGNMKKEETRKLAQKYKLPNWNKQGTSGICFVGNIMMHNFLKQRIKEQSGKVITPEGLILGTHRGTSFYTIGQKVGPHIGVIINKPLKHAQARFYVAEKKKNILIVAPEGHSALKRKKVEIMNLRLINKKEKIHSPLKARIRHLGQLHTGKMNNKEFTFSKPLEALAEGQYLVLYHKDQVIGSGEIRISK